MELLQNFTWCAIIPINTLYCEECDAKAKALGTFVSIYAQNRRFHLWWRLCNDPPAGKRIRQQKSMDRAAIAESTPGPIAINCSTYIGYKKEGIPGALFATLGMVLPSFTIIYLISLFFDQFLAITWVASAFRGIQVCVLFLILSAGLKMLKKIKKNAFTVTVMCVTFACMVIFGLFAVSFSSIFYILISGGIGLLIYAVSYMREQRAVGKEDEK